jgi:hypothetical protein
MRKADDGGELRENLDERPLILSFLIAATGNSNSAYAISYKLRWSIESAFTQSDFSRIAIEYDEPARNYLASDCLAAAILWVVLMLFGLRNQADSR